MAATTTMPVTADTPITIKISVNDNLRKLKLPLKDLGAPVLPIKLRHYLGVTPAQTVVFERFSDSAGGYIVLDPANPAVFKTLIRAAKAKLKLRLKATITPDLNAEVNQELAGETAKPAHNPIIARTPVYQVSLRESTAMDGRAVGPGIFQFKDSRESLQKGENKMRADEAPVPRSFSSATMASADLLEQLSEAQAQAQRDLALRSRPSMGSLLNPSTWSVYCNACDKAMTNEHFHCSVCDGGDYDLCEGCVEDGQLCPGEGHWLVKRFIRDGKVISSTTERLAPKPTNSKDILVETEVKTGVANKVPGAFTDDFKTLIDCIVTPSRTCNSCIHVAGDNEFVTCSDCDDYDLCLPCHQANSHGHHPGHNFSVATTQTQLSLMHEALLPAGRNVRHNATCDGCDKNIYGVRHKCFNCPDFDYCNDCVKQARHTHPHHRFAALYEPIAARHQVVPRHHGIYCDGPNCTSKPLQTYIEGVRYKCVVCHDTDFCASCEAQPGHSHNKTHPLLKIKTPIRGLNVSTMSENPCGVVRDLGDRKASPEIKQDSATTQNATAPVQTVADIKPSVVALVDRASSEASCVSSSRALTLRETASIHSLNAYFVRDAIADDTTVAPNTRFTQVWTLRNPGPHAWPAGCSVRFIGGDNMLDLDRDQPASVTSMSDASETNVIGREVQPGEEVAFKVTMKAPVREGKAISYWRLKSANGTPFGHKLWCDVNVKSVGSIGLSAVPVSGLPTLASLPTLATLPTLPVRPVPNLPCALPRTPRFYAQIQERLRALKDANDLRHEHFKRAQAEWEQQRSQLAQTVPPQAGPSSTVQPLGMPSRAAVSEEAFAQLPNWRQQMEDFVKQTTASPMLHPSMPHIDDMAPASESVHAEVSELVMEKPQAQEEVEPSPETEDVSGEQLKGSQMIFPTLEKESPASSTYQSMTSSRISKGKAAYVEDEETGDKTADAQTSTSPAVAATTVSPLTPDVPSSEAAPAIEDGFEDLTDDLEVLSAEGAESEDDGFMTDEEYDILDASDQETVASK